GKGEADDGSRLVCLRSAANKRCESSYVRVGENRLRFALSVRIRQCTERADCMAKLLQTFRAESIKGRKWPLQVIGPAIQLDYRQIELTFRLLVCPSLCRGEKNST